MPSLTEIHFRHAKHYLERLLHGQQFFRQGGEATLQGLAIFDLERLNIEAGQAWAALNAHSDHGAQVLCSLYPLAADLLRMRQHPERRARWLQEALRATEELADADRMACHFSNLAIALAEGGDHRQAVSLYERGLAYFRDQGDRLNEAIALKNLGGFLLVLGDHGRAREYLEGALPITRKLGDVDLEAATLNEIGSLLMATDDPRGAVGLFEQSLALLERTDNPQFKSTVLGNLGHAYSVLGDE
jgi:tetratricopeptide (TPR) repeat protein